MLFPLFIDAFRGRYAKDPRSYHINQCSQSPVGCTRSSTSFIHEPQWGDELSLKSADYLKLNPNGLVPVLIHENGILWESNTICRYIATKAQRLIYYLKAQKKKQTLKNGWIGKQLN